MSDIYDGMNMIKNEKVRKSLLIEDKENKENILFSCKVSKFNMWGFK